MSTHDPATTPQSVFLAGAFAILAGVSAVIGMITVVLQGNLSLDLAFVGIPIGYGLLSGRPTSRNWALFFSAVGFVMIAAFGIWVAYAHTTEPERFSSIEITYSAIGLILLAGCCGFVFLALMRPDVRKWFQIARDEPANGRHWAAALLILTGFFALSETLNEWRIRRMFEDLSAFHATVIPYDVETGEGIQHISWKNEHDSLWTTGPEMLPKMNVGTIATREGLQLEVTGADIQPARIVISSDGFEDTPVELSPGMTPDLRVPMHPVDDPGDEE